MHMKNQSFFLLAFLLLLAACSSSTSTLFRKKTPLENYTDKMEDEGLHNTPEGRQWLAVKELALRHPVVVKLPYSQSAVFSPARQQALGLRFSASQGERLDFHFTKENAVAFVLYAELYKQGAGGETSLVQAVDTNTADVSYDVPESGDYILKIQPQLFRAGAYKLTIGTGPSLSFPAADKKAYIGSVWGDSREGGRRSHEGVDIFAPKGSPAVAAADGVVESVREGGLGGKTVWLRPDGKNISLYYAHLDRQDVQEGQRVKTGDVLGLVGNTGNAKFTPAHLHFGVYGIGGAVNPAPYVNRDVKAPTTPTQKELPSLVRMLKEQTVNGTVIKKHTLLTPLARTANTYLAELPDGRVLPVALASAQQATDAIKKAKTAAVATLLPSPLPNEKALQSLPAGASVSVIGYFNEYTFVRINGAEGWLLGTALKG